MTKIYVPDIECDSCVRLISKKMKDNNIHNFKVDDESVVLDDASTKEKAISIIRGLGYRASEEPFENMTFKERFRSVSENPEKYSVEFKGLTYAVNVFVILLALFLIAYFGFLKAIPGFIQSYAVWILYLLISITVLSFGLWHFLSYRGRVTHMAGMMIGMTFGMQTGMLIGAVLGATNGFFVGAMTGMILGVIVGILTGKCCGIMGIMEGMMAGVMGGTMGPMITVMMIYDHISVFMPFFVGFNILIVLGLSYLFYEEVVEKGSGVERKPVDFALLASLCVIAGAVLILIMIYGPKSFIAGV